MRTLQTLRSSCIDGQKLIEYNMVEPFSKLDLCKAHLCLKLVIEPTYATIFVSITLIW